MKAEVPAIDRRVIVMLGVHPDSRDRGGIAAVIDIYRDNGLFARWSIEYIATVTSGSVVRKIGTAAAAIWRFLALLIAGRVTLVHAHSASRASFWRKSSFVLLALAARRPVILHLHGGRFEHFYTNECGPVRKTLVRAILNRVNRVVVLSSQWKTQIERIAPRATTVCLFNPVAVAPEPPARQRSASDLLFLGRLTDAKGLFDLFAALATIRRRFPAVRLRCGGDGDIPNVKERAGALGITDCVDVLGWISGSEKQRWLSEAAVYVLPSYAEGLPMGVLEAMAAGMPVVSTPVGGIPDAIEDGVEGFLVEPGNVDGLAERIMQLLGNEELRRAMGIAAWTRAQRDFSTDHVILQIETLYKSLGARPTSMRTRTDGVETAAVRTQE
jgi:glycosyltransferase involved in cell wall biosynthesis